MTRQIVKAVGNQRNASPRSAFSNPYLALASSLLVERVRVAVEVDPPRRDDDRVGRALGFFPFATMMVVVARVVRVETRRWDFVKPARVLVAVRAPLREVRVVDPSARFVAAGVVDGS